MPRVKKTLVEDKVEGAVEVKEAAVPEIGFYQAMGRRKTATARARLYLATQEVIIKGKKLEKGDIYVNGLPIEQTVS